MKRLSTLRIPEETHAVIKQYAIKREMSVLQFIRYILDNWAKRHNYKQVVINSAAEQRRE